MNSVLLMAQLSVYASTAKKTDRIQFSDQVLYFSFCINMLLSHNGWHYALIVGIANRAETILNKITIIYSNLLSTVGVC